MGEKKYLTFNDVNMRLNESLVKYKGVFYYAKIEDTREINNLRLYPLDATTPFDKRGSILVDPNSDDLDASSPELGYSECTSWNEAVFISRLPYRRQKQGASPENVVYSNMFEKGTLGVSRNWFFTKGFINMLNDKYPPFASLIKSIVDTPDKEKYICRAVNRDFCIEYKKGVTLIIFRTEICGEYNLKTNLVTLLEEYDNSVFRNKFEEIGVYCA